MNVDIELTEPVSLTFSLKYLVNFCKASALSNTVKICLSNEVPLLVEYNISGNSYLRFYLAPKVRDTATIVTTDEAAGLLTLPHFRSGTRRAKRPLLMRPRFLFKRCGVKRRLLRCHAVLEGRDIEP